MSFFLDTVNITKIKKVNEMELICNTSIDPFIFNKKDRDKIMTIDTVDLKICQVLFGKRIKANLIWILKAMIVRAKDTLTTVFYSDVEQILRYFWPVDRIENLQKKIE